MALTQISALVNSRNLFCFRQLRNNDETALSHVSKHCASFVKTVLGDIDEKDLVHNALAAFGICLREEEFTR